MGPKLNDDVSLGVLPSSLIIFSQNISFEIVLRSPSEAEAEAEAAWATMMLGLGGCPRLCTLHNTTSSLLSQSKTIQSYQTYQSLLPFLSENASSTASFLSSIHRLREPQLGFRVVLDRERIGLCVSARKRRKGAGTLWQVDGIGDDRDDCDDEYVLNLSLIWRGGFTASQVDLVMVKFKLNPLILWFKRWLNNSLGLFYFL